MKSYPIVVSTCISWLMMFTSLPGFVGHLYIYFGKMSRFLDREHRLVIARGYWWGKGGKKDGYVYKGETGVSFVDRDRMKG